ncbi:LysR family transcriptional regulator [Streptomyces sp. NPDC058193]|uniref:LysR family transcriptional regulator n=2 Tax=unclassified Streptomyces TaxID=2593676 RepID=UPI0036E6D74B
MRDHVIYESRLELSRLLFADFDPAVRGIVAQPFLLKTVLEGKARWHIPDYLLLTEQVPVVADHGNGYVSEHLTSVCRRMGISIQSARLRTGRDKGPVERYFRTLRERLLQVLPGYKGPDIYSRGESPEDDAFFFLDELEAIIREWTAAVYHCRPHSSLVDPGLRMSPAKMFEHGMARAGYIEVPRDRDLAFEFLQTKWRTVQHYGVEIGRLRYSGPGLPEPGVRSPYDSPVKNGWLIEQYVHRRRTLPDLAREAGMSTATMARWAHTHSIPLRPRGGASHQTVFRTADEAEALPVILRKALTGPYARQRLARFLAAQSYPTLTEAAQDLGIHQSALVIQINRLERDLGKAVLERAERGRAMKLTPFGEKVIAAISTMQGQIASQL